MQRATRRPVLMAMGIPNNVDDDDLDPLEKKGTIVERTRGGESMRRKTEPVVGGDGDALRVLAPLANTRRDDLAVHDTWETWTVSFLPAQPRPLGLFLFCSVVPVQLLNYKRCMTDRLGRIVFPSSVFFNSWCLFRMPL